MTLIIRRTKKESYVLMKKIIFPSLLFLVFSCTYGQNISKQTRNIVNSIRSVNELNYDEINEEGKKSAQYFNFTKLNKIATPDELVYLANNDTSNVVKGYALWALIKKKHPSIEPLYENSVKSKNYVVTDIAGIETTVFIYDYMRYKLSKEMSKQKEDSTYLALNNAFDSILIMNYQWKESDVLMDYIIEDINQTTEILSKRKRWLANSYFLHNIAKHNDAYLYGTECGYPEVKPYLRSVLEKAMLDTTSSRVSYFDKWISCDILVVKVYGIEALIRLQNKGEKLNELQLSIINEYKNSYKSIQVCTKYYRERLPVKKVLEKFELKGNEG